MVSSSKRVHVISPTGVYDRQGAADALGVSLSAISHETRRGNLRVATVSKKYVILGQWLLDWISSSATARKRHRRSASQAANLRVGDKKRNTEEEE